MTGGQYQMQKFWISCLVFEICLSYHRVYLHQLFGIWEVAQALIFDVTLAFYLTCISMNRGALQVSGS